MTGGSRWCNEGRRDVYECLTIGFHAPISRAIEPDTVSYPAMWAYRIPYKISYLPQIRNFDLGENVSNRPTKVY